MVVKSTCAIKSSPSLCDNTACMELACTHFCSVKMQINNGFFLAAMRYVFIGLHVIASLPTPPRLPCTPHPHPYPTPIA